MRAVHTLLAFPLLLSLSACPSAGPDDGTTGADAESDTGGTDTGGTDTGGTDTGEPAAELGAIGQTHLGMEMTASDLTATADAGDVVVVHTGYWGNCCFEPSASVVVDGAVVTVSYEDIGELCNCECSWELSYRIMGLEPGTWTVKAGGLSADVDL